MGSYSIGKKIGNFKKLLRLYGFLELGIALSALLFVTLIHFYPTIYIPYVFWDLTTHAVITLERVYGIKINDVAGMKFAVKHTTESNVTYAHICIGSPNSSFSCLSETQTALPE